MTKTNLIWFLVLALIVPSYAQKVKYKDIFALLSTKQYEQAEPFLKRYLKDNPDDPNAFLFMGITFQEKSLKTDILKETSTCIAYMDSAILNYDQSYKFLTEKEVRRRDEYYQAYNRRDLRTGEFGVKLSDIQFDIDKRKESLRERTDKIKMIKHFYSLSDTLYKKSNALFLQIQSQFPGERQLYLRADENTVTDLKTLSTRYDSAVKAFDSYKASLSNLGSKTGYNQSLTVLEINNFKYDGAEVADFLDDEVRVWNYKAWADKASNIIEKETMPMLKHLVSYDVEINKLREKLEKDSVSVSSDLTKLIDRLLYDQLKKFDPQPLPMELFSLKTADLEYRSALIESRHLKDSADVHFTLSLVNKESHLLKQLDSLANGLATSDIDSRVLDYSRFINNTYGSATVLKSYVHGLREFAEREKKIKSDELAVRLKALNWIIDGTDSIPLLGFNDKNKFRPLMTLSEKFTTGLQVVDSANAEGYFYTINAKRKPEVKVKFPVDKQSFRQRTIAQTKSLIYSDAAGQIYYILVYAQNPIKNKIPITLAKIYRSDGLAWSNNYQLSFVPTEITIKPETGEVILRNESTESVVDKNGKFIR